MSPLDIMLDANGDWIDDGAGGWQTTPTAATACRHQLLDRRGEWVGDPTAGRTSKGIPGRNSTQAELESEADSVREALAVLVREGLIADVEIVVARDTAGRWAMEAHCRDLASGGPIDLALTEFGP